MRDMATWQDVRRLALALPGTSEEARSAGAVWMVNKKLFAWERPLRPADIAALGNNAPRGPIVGIRTVDLGFKEVLLASDPSVFFTTPHFDGYPAVLIRLGIITTKQLRKVLLESWLASAPKRLIAAHPSLTSARAPRFEQRKTR